MGTLIVIAVAILAIGLAWKLLKGVLTLVVIGGIVLVALLVLSGHLGLPAGL